MFYRIIYITLFSFFVISPIYGLTNSTDLSCNKANSPVILKSILARFAINSDLAQMNEFVDNFNQQVISGNNSNEAAEDMEAIKASFESGNNFDELSAIYRSNMSKYSSYELFTSKVFCEQMNILAADEIALMNADSLFNFLPTT